MTRDQPAIVRDRDRNAEGRPENARPRDRFGRPLPRDAVDELADRVEPETVVSSVAEALAYAARLFDAERFFEAHEFFEHAWKSDEVAEADRDFWKGVTQVAVGCAHTQRGNDAGAITLLQRAIRYLDGYPSPYHGVDRDGLVAAAEQVIAQIRERGASPDLDFPRFPLAGRSATT
ncbi:MAG TPA: DUF309 domain-containing protein [Egibacteraceae bacterium]